MSSHVTDGSNWRLTHCGVRQDPAPAASRGELTLPVVSRGRVMKLRDQRGRTTPCAAARSVSRGGTEKRLRTSRSRTPATCDVDRQHERLMARRGGAREHVARHAAVVHDVELEPLRPGRDRADLLDRERGERRLRVDRADRVGGARDRALAVGVVEPRHARRRADDRQRDLAAQRGRGHLDRSTASTSIRGSSSKRSKPVRLRRTVTSSHAAPSTYSKIGCGTDRFAITRRSSIVLQRAARPSSEKRRRIACGAARRSAASWRGDEIDEVVHRPSGTRIVDLPAPARVTVAPMGGIRRWG